MSAKAKKPKPKPLFAAPKSMTLRFREPEKVAQFIALAKELGYHGTQATEGEFTRVTVIGFKNKTAYAALTAAWASKTVHYE